MATGSRSTYLGHPRAGPRWASTSWLLPALHYLLYHAGTRPVKRFAALFPTARIARHIDRPGSLSPSVRAFLAFQRAGRHYAPRAPNAHGLPSAAPELRTPSWTKVPLRSPPCDHKHLAALDRQFNFFTDILVRHYEADPGFAFQLGFDFSACHVIVFRQVLFAF